MQQQRHHLRTKAVTIFLISDLLIGMIILLMAKPTLAMAASGGSYEPSGTTASGASITTGDGGDWEKKNAESPVTITFPSPNSSDKNYDPNYDVASYGKPYYSINYVDRNDFLSFSSPERANKFNTDPTTEFNSQTDFTYNPGNLTSKMDATNKLKSGETYDNGFLKISGNVPIHAQLAQSKTTVDSAMAGNWGVMARITLPAGVDAKSLGGAVDWSGSYFYLNLQTIKALGFQLKNINFPLQFAHHVYLDPDHANVFYLKVKGIPFGYTASDNGTAATMKLLDNADTRDYLNNVYLDSSGQPSTLDQIGSPSTIDGHPNFPTQTGGKSTIWDPYYGLVKDTFSEVCQMVLKDSFYPLEISSCGRSFLLFY